MRYRLPALAAQDKDKDGKGPRGRAPHIHAAMQQLEHAEKQLEKAENVYGGHRAKALDLVKRAQQELKLGLQYAREHQPKPGTPPARKP